MQTAKLFWHGRSQAVRWPKQFRCEGKTVRIRRHGKAVILEPIASDWSWLDAIVGKLDKEVSEAINAPTERHERPEP